MLGALGGVTIAAMVLNFRGFKPAVLALWVLFVATAGAHVYVV